MKLPPKLRFAKGHPLRVMRTNDRRGECRKTVMHLCETCTAKTAKSGAVGYTAKLFSYYRRNYHYLLSRYQHRSRDRRCLRSACLIPVYAAIDILTAEPNVTFRQCMLKAQKHNENINGNSFAVCMPTFRD